MTPTRRFHLIIAIVLLFVLLPILGFIGCYLASLRGRDAMAEWNARATKVADDTRGIFYGALLQEHSLVGIANRNDSLAYMTDAQFDAFMQKKREEGLMKEELNQLSQRYKWKVTSLDQLRSHLAKMEEAQKELRQVGKAELAAARAEQRKSSSWEIYAHVFAVASLGIFLGVFMNSIWFYSTVSRLRLDLKSRGYDFLSFHDTAIIYVSTLHFARTLPDAATVLMLPDYGPEPDKIVYYIRDHLRYKAQK